MSDDMPALSCPVCGGAVDIQRSVWDNRPRTPEGEPLYTVILTCKSPLTCPLYKCKLWLRESDILSQKEAVSQCA